jgi:hypothetical protein
MLGAILAERLTDKLLRDEQPAMSVIKSLWHSVQGDPVFMRRVNGWMTIFWIAMIPISYSMGWLSSVTYVSALSLWALVASHWSTWQAARVEVEQQQQAADPVERRVVDAMVQRTNVEAAEGFTSQ